MNAIQTRASAAAIAAALAVPAFAQDVPEEIGSAVDAAQSAGVVETLTGGGEFTVFVPSNDAVAAAPQDALTELTGNPEELASVIQGYAIEGTVMAADAIALAEEGGGSTTVTSLGGGTLTVMVEDGTVMVGPSEDSMATVTTPDLQLGNVTIHVIDTAFLPQ
jgi:uncharacterized surface protein with fasciclin (FAS1) repeats